MEKLIKVYVASQYTDGGKITDKRILLDNVLNSIDIGNQLINMGYAPFLPLLNHFQDQIYQQPGHVWLKLDFQWLALCDCVLRLDGKSDGAEQEEELARSLGIPIFYSLEELKIWSEKTKIRKNRC